MILIVVIGLDLSAIPRNLRRQFNQAMKPLMLEVGKYWHKKHRPMHFGRGANTRYGYEPRDPKYQRYKQKVMPRPDLVFTGRLNRYTAHGQKITATSRMATVRMNTPSFYKRKQSNLIKKELVMIDQKDHQSITRKAMALAKAAMRKILRRKKT